MEFLLLHYLAILLLSVFLTLLIAVMLCFTRKCWARSAEEDTIKHSLIPRLPRF